MGDASKRIETENVDACSEQISADEKPIIADGSSVIYNTNMVLEVYATNAELRIAELEKLLKAKEDECARLNDLLVYVERRVYETMQICCKDVMKF
ncbi:hypothetical protein V6N13_027222 [Hibiscus sabdariffa]